MKKYRVLTAIWLATLLIAVQLAGGWGQFFRAAAQSITPTPLSLTPLEAPPLLPVPITATSASGLALFAAVEMPFPLAGPTWLPGGSAVILTNNGLQTLFPPDGSSFDLDMTAGAGEPPTVRVKMLALATAGRRLVGGGSFLPNGVAEGFVRTWDTATGQVLDTARGMEGGLLSMALRPDGGLIAAGSGSGITLWQVAENGTLEPGLTVEGQFLNVRFVAFSPDGSLLAASANNGTVVYRLDGGPAPVALQGRSIAANQVAFSPDGSRLAAVDAGMTSDNLVIWTLATGEQIDLSQPNPGAWSPNAGALSFSPDGSLLAAAFRDEVRLWEVSSGQIVALMKVETGENPVDALSFSPDGTQLMAGDSYGGHLWVWGIQ
jgi:WD40 repeat protein